MRFRTVDPGKDLPVLLEFHCQANYASETPWARTTSYEAYRERWLATRQPDEFLQRLHESLEDPRTLAEVGEEEGEAVAWLWVTFEDVPDYDLTLAEVNDLVVASPRRRRGLGLRLMERAERRARERGADVLRSETGIENTASHRLHERAGFRPFRTHYEKRL